MDRLARSPLLPTVAGIVSVMLLFRGAAYRIGWEQLGIPLLVAVVWALVLWLLLYFTPYIKRLTRKESGIVGAALVLITMSWMDFPSSLIAACIAWVVLVLIVLSKPRVQSWINRIGTWWLVSALLVTVVWSGIVSLQKGENDTTALGNNTVPTDTMANIYLVIPDRFTSIAGLYEFGDDSSTFVDGLRGHGFYIREDALSMDEFALASDPVATTRTLRFMASLYNDGQHVPLDISYNKASRLVQDADTIGRLKSAGYTYHNIGSWYTETKAMVIADHNYSYKGYDLKSYLYRDELSVAVLNRSFLRELDASVLMRFSGYDTRREEHWYQWQTVVDISSISAGKPSITTAHIMLPHPPFIWAADGAALPDGGGMTDRYIEQVKFTKGYLLNLVDAIIAVDPDAIVLLQSDEGFMTGYLEYDSELSEKQRNGVLLAWRVPGVDRDNLADIKPTEILGYVTEYVLEGETIIEHD